MILTLEINGAPMERIQVAHVCDGQGMNESIVVLYAEYLKRKYWQEIEASDEWYIFLAAKSKMNLLTEISSNGKSK